MTLKWTLVLGGLAWQVLSYFHGFAVGGYVGWWVTTLALVGLAIAYLAQGRNNGTKCVLGLMGIVTLGIAWYIDFMVLAWLLVLIFLFNYRRLVPKSVRRAIGAVGAAYAAKGCKDVYDNLNRK